MRRLRNLVGGNPLEEKPAWGTWISFLLSSDVFLSRHLVAVEWQESRGYSGRPRRRNNYQSIPNGSNPSSRTHTTTVAALSYISHRTARHNLQKTGVLVIKLWRTLNSYGALFLLDPGDSHSVSDKCSYEFCVLSFIIPRWVNAFIFTTIPMVPLWYFICSGWRSDAMVHIGCSVFALRSKLSPRGKNNSNDCYKILTMPLKCNYPLDIFKSMNQDENYNPCDLEPGNRRFQHSCPNNPSCNLCTATSLRISNWHAGKFCKDCWKPFRYRRESRILRRYHDPTGWQQLSSEDF